MPLGKIRSSAGKKLKTAGNVWFGGPFLGKTGLAPGKEENYSVRVELIS